MSYITHAVATSSMTVAASMTIVFDLHLLYYDHDQSLRSLLRLNYYPRSSVTPHRHPHSMHSYLLTVHACLPQALQPACLPGRQKEKEPLCPSLKQWTHIASLPVPALQCSSIASSMEMHYAMGGSVSVNPPS